MQHCDTFGQKINNMEAKNKSNAPAHLSLTENHLNESLGKKERVQLHHVN